MGERENGIDLDCACFCDRRCGLNSLFNRGCHEKIHKLSRFAPIKEGYCRGIMVVDDNTVKYLDCPKEEGVENYIEVAEVNQGKFFY